MRLTGSKGNQWANLTATMESVCLGMEMQMLETDLILVIFQIFQDASFPESKERFFELSLGLYLPDWKYQQYCFPITDLQLSDVTVENIQEIFIDKQNLTQVSADLASKNQRSLFAR